MSDNYTAQQVVRLRKLLQGKGISAKDCDAIGDFLVGDADLPENMEVRGAKVAAMDRAIGSDAFGNVAPRPARMSASAASAYDRAFPSKVKVIG